MRVKAILILAVCIVALLNGCGPETSSLGDLAQAEATPTREAASPTPEPTVISPLPTPTPSPEPTAVVSLPTATSLPEPTAVYTEPIPAPDYTPTPIPTPDMNAVTVPELDNIAFVNPRPLQLPEASGPSTFSLIAWSPDSKRFLGTLMSEETIWVGSKGKRIQDLYLGNPETSELQFLRHNTGWPAWSRDGDAIYYLVVRSDGETFYYDLFTQKLDSEKNELIVPDVSAPFLPQPAALETNDNRLLTLNREHQPVLVRSIDNEPMLTPIASLPGLQDMAGQRGYFSLAPNGHTGEMLSGGNVYVTDLAIEDVRAIDVSQSQYRISTAWSADSRYLAYAGSHGVFIYDHQTDKVHEVITLRDFGFPEHDSRTGFNMISWSPNEEVLLFSASTPNWSDRGYGPAPVGFIFVATADGSQWKAVSSRYIVDSIAPDKSRAVVTDWSNWPELKQYLVDVVWE